MFKKLIERLKKPVYEEHRLVFKLMDQNRELANRIGQEMFKTNSKVEELEKRIKELEDERKR